MTSIIVRYAMFAVIATAANLATQRAVLQAGETGWYFAIAVGAGTVVGLVIKYILDKRWIFCDFDTGLRNHGRKFSMYATTGIATTAIFWGTETAFWLIWDSHAMRELGALLGLGIGYVAKYRLDKRYVFNIRPVQVPA